jgi:Pvc16 N-terminal domain
VSNAKAVAAVTLTLRHLLFVALNAELGGTDVSTRPPDKARVDGGNQLNLFLYQTTVNAAWRNQELPDTLPGEAAHPPLPLVLHYLITAYGADDNDALAHRLIGRAMSTLHDHPLLGRDEIKDALVDNDLHQQVERIRVTLAPLTLDEMSKLWTAFQTQYRLSAAYEASVVLIESTRPVRTPLPVLTRNIVVQPDVVSPFPTLDAVVLPGRQPSARLGDTVTVAGHHLDGTTAVRLSHPRLPDPLTVPPPPLTTIGAAEVGFVLPDLPAQVPAGTWTVAAVLGGPDRLSGELPLRVAPRVTGGLPADLARDVAGRVVLTVQVSPDVLPEQPAFLLLGERQVAAEPLAAPGGSLEFRIPVAQPGEHLVRIRTDGVDSHLVDWSADPPTFDPSQKVTIT